MSRLLLLPLFLFACTTVVALQEQAPTFILPIKVVSPDGEMCTATPIGHGLALTVKHFAGKKWAEHPTEDIALVEVGDYPEFIEKGSVRLQDPILGETLFCLGFPLNGSLTQTSGFASALSGESSIPIAPGNSGSPVYDGEGKLVGVMSSLSILNSGFTVQFVWHCSQFTPASRFWPWVEEQLSLRRSQAADPASRR